MKRFTWLLATLMVAIFALAPIAVLAQNQDKEATAAFSQLKTDLKAIFKDQKLFGSTIKELDMKTLAAFKSVSPDGRFESFRPIKENGTNLIVFLRKEDKAPRSPHPTRLTAIIADTGLQRRVLVIDPLVRKEWGDKLFLARIMQGLWIQSQLKSLVTRDEVKLVTDDPKYGAFTKSLLAAIGVGNDPEKTAHRLGANPNNPAVIGFLQHWLQ